MSNKILFGGLVGGLATFLLGWLVYGILLADFTAANNNNAIMRPMEEMIWWAIILSNLLGGFLIAIIFSWSGVSGFTSGMIKGAILGAFISACFDFSMYSMSTMFLNGMAIVVDIIASTVMYAVAGGVVAWVMGMNAEKKAA